VVVVTSDSVNIIVPGVGGSASKKQCWVEQWNLRPVFLVRRTFLPVYRNVPRSRAQQCSCVMQAQSNTLP